MWVFPKIGGKPPQMDGENHGKPYEQMDDLGVLTPLFLVQHPCVLQESPLFLFGRLRIG